MVLGIADDAGAASDSPYKLSPPASVDPALPNVLLLGDSISIGYCPVVRTILAGKANVYGIAGSEAATIKLKGGLRLDTQSALEHLDNWLSDKKWTVIHFNWGLHDIKLDDKGQHQVPIEDYEKNLAALIGHLKATHAQLIWASTTPVPPGANLRKAGDEIPYNAVARRVMESTRIPLDDLHGLAVPHQKEWQRPANVHFNEAGNLGLGHQVASAVQAALMTASVPASQQTEAPLN